VQVAQTNHPVLQFVRAHDYKAFYAFELQGRRQFGYPPFTRMIQLTFKHRAQETVAAAAAAFADNLRPALGKYMVGPAEPVVSRIRNQYLMELVFKLPKDARLIQACKEAIRLQEAYLHQHPSFKSVVVLADVDCL
jgi:primosomal protein N' (replication factor Y)